MRPVDPGLSSGGQALAAFGATCVDHGTTTTGRHAGTKAMTARTFQTAWLEGTLHCSNLVSDRNIRSTDTNSTVLDRPRRVPFAATSKDRTGQGQKWPTQAHHNTAKHRARQGHQALSAQIRRAVRLVVVKLSTARYAESASRPDSCRTHLRVTRKNLGPGPVFWRKPFAHALPAPGRDRDGR